MTTLGRLAGFLLLAASMTASAVTMDITASFVPSMANPENNTFTNTTEQSGYCARWPDSCINDEHSLATGLVLTPNTGLTAEDQPRDSLFFKWPSTFQRVEMTNLQTGDKQIVKFRIDSFSGKYIANSDAEFYSWGPGTGRSAFSVAPQGGCSALSPGWLIGNTQMAWLWGIPEGNTGCYRISRIDRPVGETTFIKTVEDVSIGYTMVAPNPLKMSAGNYTGSVHYSVGAGGDIDFGDNYQPSDSVVDINFTLTVNHELKVSTTAEDQKVSLQPCAAGKICNEEEGKANWERWMASGTAPQLTGRSNFTISSSGMFTVYLNCEQTSGSGCALKSDNTGELVPIQTLLTLPVKFIDHDSGQTISRREIFTGFDASRNIFDTAVIANGVAGSFDFLVNKSDVKTMLKNAPDTYRGAVTVIFDPKLY